jgi:saccharopine dehydrogenase-like NADP-dependent oxidoreductase
MRALILGATGAVGRRLCGELARSEHIDELIISARSRDRVERLAVLLGGPSRRLHPIMLDVEDHESVVAAARRVDVVASTAGPAYETEEPAARSALDAGTHYVSLCDDQAPAEIVNRLDDRARAKGVTIVPGCGMSPGITNYLVALGAGQFDAAHEVEIAVGRSAREVGGDAGRLHLLDAFAEQTSVVSNHLTETEVAPGTPKLVYFPEPVGWVETFVCAHPEMASITRSLPELRSLSFHLGLTERSVMDATRALVGAGLAADQSRRRMVLRLARPALPILRALPPRGATWSALRIDVRGVTNGRIRTVSLGVVDHLHNLATLSLAHAAIELGLGNASGTGVLSPDRAFDAKTMLRWLSSRGIRAARLESEVV